MGGFWNSKWPSFYHWSLVDLAAPPQTFPCFNFKNFSHVFFLLRSCVLLSAMSPRPAILNCTEASSNHQHSSTGLRGKLSCVNGSKAMRRGTADFGFEDHSNTCKTYQPPYCRSTSYWRMAREMIFATFMEMCPSVNPTIRIYQSRQWPYPTLRINLPHPPHHHQLFPHRPPTYASYSPHVLPN